MWIKSVPFFDSRLKKGKKPFFLREKRLFSRACKTIFIIAETGGNYKQIVRLSENEKIFNGVARVYRQTVEKK